MKIAFVADLHIEGRKLQDKKEAWEKAVDDMIKNEISICAILGDIFGSRNIGGRESSTGTVFKAFIDPLCKFLGNEARVIVLPGNHDLAFGQQKSALETLRLPRLSVAEENQFIVDSINQHITMAVVPWNIKNDRGEKLQKFLSITKNHFKHHTGIKIFVGHLTVKGSMLNSGVPIFGSEYEITKEQIEDLNVDIVALGHIHKRQGCYIGALCQNNFGEEGNPTGYMIYDTGTKEKTFREIESPKYRTITHEPGVMIDKEWNGYTKLRINGKAPEEWLTKILNTPGFSVEVIPKKINRARSIEGVKAGRSDLDLLESFLISEGIQEDEGRRIKALASELIKEAI